MCGINGILNARSSDTISHEIMQMNDLIIHRGPDDSGVYVYEHRLAMAMRRLSIIDIANGGQPMYSNDGSLAIVFNGEIYNFRELREELEASGTSFSTHCDTEVVLKIFERDGPKAFSRLNGMFALAIHDRKNSIVVLARDRMGEKPLYFHVADNRLAWASELKSLIRLLDSPAAIDPDALSLYLSLTYIPAPYTIYQGIRKLQPGNYMTIDTRTLQYRQYKYWDLTFHAQPEESQYETCREQLRSLVFDAVERRMIADVPVGVFLSGGVDSTVVAAVMAKITRQKIKTFSIGHADKRYDESGKAAAVAAHIGAEHHAYLMNEEELVPHIDRILDNYDEPFADSSALPAWLVSRKAAEHVKVALTGDGGDEVFGGYNKYLIHTYGRLYQHWLPSWTREQVIKPLFRTRIFQSGDSRSIFAKMGKLIEAAGGDAMVNHFNMLSLGFNAHALKQLLNGSNFPAPLQILTEITDVPDQQIDVLKLARYLDMKISLEGDMLAKIDRASMLCSLECRAPFLDHRLMEFTARLPDNYLIQGRVKKRILKDTFADLLPSGIFEGPKMGFEMPVGRWLRDELKKDMISTLANDRLAEHGLFNQEYVQKLVTEHLSLKADHAFRLWTLYCFQKWYGRHLTPGQVDRNQRILMAN